MKKVLLVALTSVSLFFLGAGSITLNIINFNQSGVIGANNVVAADSIECG